MNVAEEVGREHSARLEAVAHALDCALALAEGLFEAALPAAIGHERDDWARALLFDEPADATTQALNLATSGRNGKRT